MEKGRRSLSAAASVCSVASVAFCVLLSINAADLRNRLADLESARGSSVDQFNSVVEQKLDELLSQVNSTRARAHTHSVTRVRPN